MSILFFYDFATSLVIFKFGPCVSKFLLVLTPKGLFSGALIPFYRVNMKSEFTINLYDTFMTLINM